MEGTGVAALRNHYTAVVDDSDLVVLVGARARTRRLVLLHGWFGVNNAAARVLHLGQWVYSFFVDTARQIVWIVAGVHAPGPGVITSDGRLALCLME